MASLMHAVLLGLSVATAVLAGCASAQPHVTRITHDAIVTVEAIDVPNRLVTVRRVTGEQLTVYVDPANKGFPQADVGDQVRIRFVESMALRLTKASGPSELKVKESTARPAAGRPVAKAETELTAVVQIQAVRPDGSIVSFIGPRGPRAVEVRDPAAREYVRGLRPGDSVEVTYREAVALSLEKVGQ